MAPGVRVVRLEAGMVNRLALAGLTAFFTALAGRIREQYAQAGTAQEPGGSPE